jgi:phosphonate transport system ATP-binding protein
MHPARFTRADRQLALRCLDTVGLLDRAWARADRLSGGQQVHLARASADRIVALRSGAIVQDAPATRVDARTLERIYERNGEPPGGTERP